jgi:hypothetical protein
MFKEAQKRSTLGDLIDRGLLTYAEARTLQHVPNKAMAVWVWIGLLWKHKVDTTPELYLKGGAEFNRVIDGIVVQARQALQLVHTFIEVQLPVGFVHLLAVVMKLNFLILTVTCGFEIALALEEQMWSLIIADIFFLIVTPVIFQSLVDLTENLRNPLGTDQNDFPQFAYHTEIREENKGYFHASDCFAEVNKAGHAMLNSTGIKGPKTLKTDAAKYRVANGAGKVAASKFTKITPATSPTPPVAGRHGPAGQVVSGAESCVLLCCPPRIPERGVCALRAKARGRCLWIGGRGGNCRVLHTSSVSSLVRCAVSARSVRGPAAPPQQRVGTPRTRRGRRLG